MGVIVRRRYHSALLNIDIPPSNDVGKKILKISIHGDKNI